MENKASALVRHLAPLKLISRLLRHEIHAQGTAKTITLSREELGEIQTTIDLYIEEAHRRGGVPGTSMVGQASDLPTAGETHLVPTRN